ncbi:hypothetical protein BV22DRAFT_1052508 [Leucogyrophana mollusca]|uniref:Uncharacterized protein n=1 Tax=Leucogyrophana mollusca TaxID=85980 RepID=A0ACB8AVT7_9AGAM|nr:hypothetical protein BV22DRAFT_1052508 [Leucogyrophana mollusca]
MVATPRVSSELPQSIEARPMDLIRGSSRVFLGSLFQEVIVHVDHAYEGVRIVLDTAERIQDDTLCIEAQIHYSQGQGPILSKVKESSRRVRSVVILLEDLLCNFMLRELPDASAPLRPLTLFPMTERFASGDGMYGLEDGCGFVLAVDGKKHHSRGVAGHHQAALLRDTLSTIPILLAPRTTARLITRRHHLNSGRRGHLLLFLQRLVPYGDFIPSPPLRPQYPNDIPYQQSRPKPFNGVDGGFAGRARSAVDGLWGRRQESNLRRVSGHWHRLGQSY